ncbi:cytosine methyltransferase [Paenibacillus sp. VT-400]|uniref:DNA cytosine methyltransferase n=1 Tax=Paenibacillus sp. VT-400 TaxID=1495853 RepID=UPI00064B7633|nr:DNA (cytosine-5-)-methyltransferase [Paenibacillus sp. VT-400]KLU57921.1 cytosine methyltransferase [Paenibacillus sp. VT-400]
MFAIQEKQNKSTFTFLEFFAGSGLVTYALKNFFKAVWANDIDKKKSIVYKENNGSRNFNLDDVKNINGGNLPRVELSWASFPCQDLSLAGLSAGINGKRSGVVWEWLRVLDEMQHLPPILVAENVEGLMSSGGGNHYRVLHEALRSRGYKVGAIMLDAALWIPQSRPRIFVIAIKKGINIPSKLISESPTWLHTKSIIKVGNDLHDWIWWNMPVPPTRKKDLADIIEWDAPCDPEDTINKTISLINPRHFDKFISENILVAPGYKRTRNGKQVLELRFDGIAGCLRTPEGGSSRQYLVLKHEGKIKTRLLTVRETARLMGAPESYKFPGSYNDGYRAMGDAVAVPVARYLAKHLLANLATLNSDQALGGFYDNSRGTLQTII